MIGSEYAARIEANEVIDMVDWTGRSVLVTGAGGFIGSHLTERLVGEGAEVRAFVRYNSRWGFGLVGSAAA